MAYYERAALTDRSALYALGLTHLQDGNLAGAESALQSLLVLRPTDVRGSKALAEIARRRGDLPGAIRILETCLQHHPDDTSLMLCLAKDLWRNGDTGKAKEGVFRAAATCPRNASALCALGEGLLRVGEIAAAQQAFERALLDEPGYSAAIVGKVEVILRGKSAVAALSYLRSAYLHCGRDLLLVKKEVDILLILGLHDEVEENLNELLSRGRRDLKSMTRLRNLYLDLGRISDAADLLARGRSDSVRDKLDEVMFNGKVAALHWDLPKAAAAYELAVQLDPSHAPAHIALAETYIGLLRPVEARRHLAIEKQLTRGAQLSRGRSLNPSQSLLGQIMMECWGNSSALLDGRAAIEASSLSEFRKAVLREPDYTPTALAMMVHLRRAGSFAKKADGGVSIKAIPKKIHQFWDSEDVPEDIESLMYSWASFNPDWEYVRFSDKTARDYLGALDDNRYHRAYRAARTSAQKADIFRLVVLYFSGGIYADADDRCLSSIDSVVASAEFVAAQELRGSVGNNFLAASPRHPVIWLALDLAVKAVIRGDSETIWLSTGPGLLTRALALHISQSDDHLADLGRRVVILERHEVRRFCWIGCQVLAKQKRHWSRSEFGQAIASSLV